MVSRPECSERWNTGSYAPESQMLLNKQFRKQAIIDKCKIRFSTLQANQGTMVRGTYKVSLFSVKKIHRSVSCMRACSVAQSQSHLTLCNRMDCSPPGSSVHGSLQARILEWVATPSSRGPSRPKDRNCTAGKFFTAEPQGKFSKYSSAREGENKDH